MKAKATSSLGAERLDLRPKGGHVIHIDEGQRSNAVAPCSLDQGCVAETVADRGKGAIAAEPDDGRRQHFEARPRPAVRLAGTKRRDMPGKAEQAVGRAHVALGQHHVVGDGRGIAFIAAVGHQAFHRKRAAVCKGEVHFGHGAMMAIIAAIAKRQCADRSGRPRGQSSSATRGTRR